jgi:hypothetical protein
MWNSERELEKEKEDLRPGSNYDFYTELIIVTSHSHYIPDLI